ncbi:hypothetical protein GCM10017687_63960 [Streptomyces echinatus]
MSYRFFCRSRTRSPKSVSRPAGTGSLSQPMRRSTYWAAPVMIRQGKDVRYPAGERRGARRCVVIAILLG